MVQHIYEKSDGEFLIKYLKKHYSIKAHLIGNLPSNHDIDIVVDTKIISKKGPIKELAEILMASKVIKTDIGSYFTLSKIFGHIDIFFEEPEKLPKKKENDEKDDLFYAGAICALAAMESYDQATMYDEVVGSIGEKDLIRVARKDGAMRWSGLSDYIRRKKNDREYGDENDG